MSLRVQLLLLLSFVLAPICGWAADCEHSGARSAKSPDERWIATVEEEVCDVGGAAAAGVVVELASAADATKTERIFSMSVPRSRDQWPKVLWKSGSELELWVPNRAAIGMRKAESQEIRIQLKYCGDNPAERAQVAEFQAAFKKWMSDTTAWAERRKRDPSLAEPRPKRPVEPTYSPDTCTDVGQ